MSHAPARRIGFCIEGDELGGAELAVENLLLAASGDWDFVLLGPDNASTRRIAETTGVETVLLPDRREQRRRPDSVRAKIKSAQLDVFQMTLCNPTAATIPIAAALSLRIPVIAVEQLVRPIHSKKRRLLKAALARRFSAHVAVGKASSAMTEELCWLAPGTVQTIYNGVAISSDTPVIRDRPISKAVTVGRLEHQKGLDILLAAVSDIADLHLTIVGSGSERDRLLRQADKLDLSDRVVFAGWQDDPGAFLQESDLFVLASRQEAFPHALVEAMLAGLPVIATDVGSVSEAVVDGETGLLVPVEDRAALKDAMSLLVSDNSLRLKVAASGQALARQRFGDKTMAESFQQLWSTLLDKEAK